MKTSQEFSPGFSFFKCMRLQNFSHAISPIYFKPLWNENLHPEIKQLTHFLRGSFPLEKKYIHIIAYFIFIHISIYLIHVF